MPAVTSLDIAHALRHRLQRLQSYTFKVEADPESRGLKGHADGVHIIFASVPRGASELDALNAKKNVMISIEAPEWSQRRVETRGLITGEIPAEIISARIFRGNMKFRKVTGSPKRVLDAIEAFFNREIP